MTPYKPQQGTYEIDRVFPGLGRVRFRTGTTDARRAAAYDAMLDSIPLEVVRLIRDRQITVREVWEAWVGQRGLPTAESLLPLHSTVARWIESPRKAVGSSEQANRERLQTALCVLASSTAQVRELPRIAELLRGRFDRERRGAGWNRLRAAAMAFLRDVVGKRSPTYEQLRDLGLLPEPAKYERHPCTVHEARQIAAALGPKWGSVWWDLCRTGMGPKEMWSDGWREVQHGTEIQGQKRPARNRVVPATGVHPVMGRAGGFSQALERSGLGVTPYDARRSFARWLEEAGIPGYRQDAYMGHGPKSMRELYKWGDITAWLAEDGRVLRQYLGESGLAVAR